MTDFVRVKLENGSKTSVASAVAESRGLEVLDEAATDRYGRVLAPEFPEEPAPSGYEALKIDRLHALIDERNAGREDSDKLSKGGNKAELAARLTADDQNTPSS